MKILKVVSIQNSSANAYLNRDNGFGKDLGTSKNEFAPVTPDAFVCFSRVS